MNEFQFNPANGLLNTTTYPTVPVNETAARTQIMAPMIQLQTAINTIINTLNNKVLLTSGAENIGSAPITDVLGDTVYEQLVDLKTQLDAVVLGQIPDGSLTNAALADATLEVAKLSETTVDYFAKTKDVETLNDNLARALFKLYITSDIPILAEELGVDGIIYEYLKTTGLIDTTNTNVTYTTSGSGGIINLNDLITGATGTATTSHGIIDVAKITDNNNATYAVLYKTVGSGSWDFPMGVKYDLGAVSTIDKVHVKLATGIGGSGQLSNWATNFNTFVYYSTDNTTWVTAKTYNYATLQAGIDEYVTINADARYIRVETSVIGVGYSSGGTGSLTIYDMSVFRAFEASKFVTINNELDITYTRSEISLMCNNAANYLIDISADDGETWVPATFESAEAWSWDTSRYEHKYTASIDTPASELKIRVYSDEDSINLYSKMYGYYIFVME